MNNTLRSRCGAMLGMLLFMALGYFLLSELMDGSLWKHQAQDSYTLQALNWLQGRTWLLNGEGYTWLELAIYEGKYYVSFPPLPSVVLVPLVLVFGENVPNNLLVGVYGLVSAALAFRVMEQAGRSPKTAAFWGVFTVFGSNMLWMTTYGGVWFQAQALNMALCLGAVLAAQKQKRGAACALLALAVGCRPFSAIYLAVYFIYLVYERRRAGWFNALKVCLRHAVIPVCIALVYMLYNYIRFDNPLEFGHNYLPEFTEAEHGQFHISYLWSNWKRLWLEPVWIENGRLQFTHFNGFMFYIANPLFLVLFASQLRALWRHRVTAEGVFLTVAMMLNLLALCMHKTLGGWQFGARYTCDLLPFALLYLARKDPPRAPTGAELFTGIAAVAFNAYGVLYMYSIT